MVLFRCLLYLLFGPVLMKKIVLFSNACSILKLMICNRNLTQLEILTSSSLNMSAPTLLLSEYLKKNVFILPAPSKRKSIFHTFSLTLKKKISYLKSTPLVFAVPLSQGEALNVQYLSKCWKWYFES